MVEFDPLTNELTNGRMEQRTSSVILSYFSILRRRIWVVIPVIIISGTVGLIKAYRTQPVFKASAKILVQRQAGIFVGRTDARDASFLNDEFFTTQRELLTSKAVMDIALRTPELQHQFEAGLEDTQGQSSFVSEIRETIAAALNVTPPPEHEPWQKLQRTIDVTYNDEGAFLFVDASSSNPTRAAKRANLVAEAFRIYHGENRLGQVHAGLSTLNTEREREELALLESEQALAQFRRNSESVFSNHEGTSEPLRERLAAVNDELTKTEIARITLQSSISIMRDALGSKVPTTSAISRQLLSIPEVHDHESLSRSRRDLADAEKEFFRLQEFYGSSHPLMQAASTNVYNLRDIFRETLNEITESQEKRLEALADTEKELRQTYEDVKKSVVSSDNEQFLYQRLVGEVTRHKSLLDMIIDKTREMDSSAGLDRIIVDIVEDAAIPRHPINAGKAETTVFSIVLGLFLGIGLAFLFENLDDSIKTPEDLTERLDIPLLGFVPTVTADGEPKPGDTAEKESKKVATAIHPIKREYTNFLKTVTRRFGSDDETLSGVNLEKKDDLESRRRAGAVVAHQPLSSIAEAYRSIRANLFYSTPADELKLLAITSSRPQEGKTTTSTNLAISVAQTGKRVLLIDADLHRPSVHKNLGLDQGNGLTSILIGETTWKDTLRRLTFDGVELDSLDVMTAGPNSPNPSELLNSKRMRELLTEVREQYDWVLIDTPPVLFVSDASIISVMCDGVILVVKSGDATRSLLARTMERLDAVRAHMIGSILNNVQVSRVGRYYSSYYNVGYSRYSSDYQRTYYAREGADELPAQVVEGPAKMGSTPSAADATSSQAGEQLSKLSVERDALQKKVVTATGKIEALERELEKQQTEFKAQLAATAATAVESQTATTDSEQLNTAIADLHTQISTARDALKSEQIKTEAFAARISEIDASSGEDQEAITEAQKANDKAMKQVAALTETAQQELAKRETTFAAEKKTMTDLIQTLKRDLSEEQKKNWMASSSEVDALEKKIEDTEGKLAKTQSNFAKAERTTEALKDAAATQKKENDAQQKEATAKQTEQASKLMAAAQETQTLTNRVKDLEAKVAAAGDPGTKLKQDLEAQTQKAKALEKDLEVLRKQLEEARNASIAKKESDTQAPVPPPVQQSTTPAAPTASPLAGRKAFRNALQQAQLHLSAGKNSAAADVTAQLLAAQPEHNEAWDMAIIAQFRKNDSAALEQSRRDLSEKPHLQHLYALANGKLAVLRNDLASARNYFEQSEEQSKKNPYALEALTRLDLQQGNQESAETHLKRFVRQFPRHPYGHYGVATLHMLDDNPKKAEDALRKSIRMSKTAEALNDLAWLLDKRGEFAVAEKTAREALSMNDKNAQVWDTLGTIQVSARKFDDALTSTEKALSLDPDDAGITLNCAELRARAGKMRDAETLCETLLARKNILNKAERQRLNDLQGMLGKA
ncbi:MAG: succinoglycan biosynthesis transport protein ExoP [Candidatus Promineifilaceae bacterium]|jgi:succinoglycan biosynthesis transport protein ExoP